MTSFTEAVHEELKGTGVSVTVLCPGFTRTGFQDAANVPAGEVPGLHVAGGRRGRDAPASTGWRRTAPSSIPGAMNKVLGSFSAVTPHAITRRVGARGAQARPTH